MVRSTIVRSTFVSFLASGLIFLSAISTSRAERLPIKIYTSADGLGSSASFNLARDARGFIWLSSRDGLVRFDGYRFTTYRVGDEFADPAVFKITPDRSGRYWVNLNRGTDYRLTVRSDREVVGAITNEQIAGDSRIPINAEPLTDTTLPFYQETDGTLWTGSEKGVFIMNERADGKYDLDPVEIPLPGNPKEGLSYLVAADARGGDGFWIGTHWGIVRRLRDGRMFHYSIKPTADQDWVRALAEDRDGRVWVSHAGSLIVVKAAEVPDGGPVPSVAARVTAGQVATDGTAIMPELPGDAVEFEYKDLLRRYTSKTTDAPDFLQPEIFGIVAGRDGQVWIATNNGLVLFDGSRFRHYTTGNGLASNSISSVVEGTEGHIWMASYGGLHRLNPRGLTTYDEVDGLERARVHSIYERGDGDMQVVSGNFSFGAFRGDSFVRVRPKLPADEIYLWQSNVGLLDSRGDWWVSTNKKLYRFTGVKRIEDLDGREPAEVYDESKGLLSGVALHLFEDSGGNMWISTFVNTARRGITRIDRATGNSTNFEQKDGLPEVASASAFVEDSKGTLWIAFNEGGIGRYKDGKIEMIATEDLPAGGITDLFRDSKGRIWIALSRGGLSRVDDPSAELPKFVTYTTADGLASNNVRCLGEDLFGRIYIGTVRGLDRLTPETGQIKYYGTSDGLATDFVSVIHRDRRGLMWIGTMNGLSKLVPEADQLAPASPVLISGLRIGDRDYSVSPLGQAEVFVPDQEPGSNNMQIDFLSVSPADAASMRYQYMIEGLDEDWSKPTEERSVTLANLAPGSHSFLVRSLINGAVASPHPAAVRFTVLRPVWQRWWFLLIVALTLAATAYAIYRYRLAQLLKLERVRTRIATDLHDDIGSSLSQIAILSEVARQKVDNDGAADPLRRIAETSRDLVDSMSDIVWAINPQKDHLSDLLQRMRRFAGDTFDATDVRYRFRFDEASRDIPLGADQRREIYLIFKECVNNTAKHSAAESVDLSVTIDGEYIRTEVSDTGRGFDVGEAMSGEIKGYGGNGLLNMRRRVERLGGEFTIESEAGKGTRVVFTIPTSSS